MDLHSSAFNDGGQVPRKFTCDGEDESPPLAWRGAPTGTLSFALLCDDPDAPAGTWRHWAVYDIPPARDSLPEALAPSARGFKQGVNDFGRRGYGGPCPPHGHGRHRYRFTLYALGAPSLELPDGARYRDIERAIARVRILAEAGLVGVYER